MTNVIAITDRQEVALPPVEATVKLILDGELDEDIRPYAPLLRLPVDRHGVPLQGPDYLLDAIADYELARDDPQADPTISDAKNLKRMRWREAYRNRRRKAFEVGPILVDPGTEVESPERPSTLRYALAEYWAIRSSLEAPSRAFDTQSGQRRIGDDAHCDVMQVDVTLGRASKEARDFAHELTLGLEQRELAEKLGVSEPTMSRWVAQFVESIEDGHPQVPRRQRAAPLRQRAA